MNREEEEQQCCIFLSAKEVLEAITAFHSLPPDAQIIFRFKEHKLPKVANGVFSEAEVQILDGANVTY
jgi:hypothetical protein